MGVLRQTGGVSAERDRQVVQGSAESDAVKDLGKPCAGELHARIDERGLETGHGLGTAAPASLCVDSAGPIGYRASPRLCRPQATTAKKLVQCPYLIKIGRVTR